MENRLAGGLNALDVLKMAFIMRADGPSTGEPLRMALLRMLSSQNLTPSQHGWYCQLEANTVVIDDALMTLERAHARTEDALHSVESALSSLEWAVLVARYSPMVPGANVKLVVPRAKVRAISTLADAATIANIISGEMLATCIVAREYASVPGLSLRSLGQSFGLSKTQIHRLAQTLGQWLAGLETVATNIATQYLLQTGLISLDTLGTANVYFPQTRSNCV